MGTPDPSKRRYQTPKAPYGLTTPPQSMEDYSQSGLSCTPTDSNMSAVVPYISDSRATEEPREVDPYMSPYSPLPQAQAHGTPAQPSAATSYDIYTDAELDRQEKIERIRAARAKTAALEAETARKLAGTGHQYGKITVSDVGTAVLGDSYDGEAPPPLRRTHTYTETAVNGGGFMKSGDLSQIALLALMRDRRSPPAATIDPKQQSTQKLQRDHHRKSYKKRHRSDQPEE